MRYRRRVSYRGEDHGAINSDDWVRWMCGPNTRFCGVGMHNRCAEAGGRIVTGGMFSAPCLCACHQSELGPLTPTMDLSRPE